MAKEDEQAEALREQTKALERMHEEQLDAARAAREAAAEEARANREAVEEASFRTEMALAAQARAVKKAISEDWRLQANAKADEAAELLKARNYDKALVLARQACEQDPSNLQAWVIAAWALKRKGQLEEAASSFEEAVSLLRAASYQGSPQWFAYVLGALPDDEKGAFTSFSAMLKESAFRWERLNECFVLLDAVLARAHGEEGRVLIDHMVREGSKYSRFQQCRPVIDELLKHGMREDARVLVDRIVQKDVSLLSCAYAMELEGPPADKSVTRLSTYLESVPAENREAPRVQFSDIMQHPLRSEAERDGSPQLSFSDWTVSQIRKALRARYERWRPEIERNRSASALAKAEDLTKSDGRHIKTGLTVGVIAFFAACAVGAMLGALGETVGYPRKDAEIVMVILGVCFFVFTWCGTISAGIYSTRRHKRKLIALYRGQATREAIEQEERAWAFVLTGPG